MDRSEFEAVVEETAEYAGKDSFTPEEHQRLKDAVFDESFRAVLRADTSYFVLGNYDEGDRERRLEAVRNELSRPATHAFLMKDVPEGWEFWPVKFRILAARATSIVPVLEDSEGSHHWESGNLFQPAYREKVYALKREYETEAAEREHFSAMVAHFVGILDEADRVCFWTTEAELLDCASDVPG